MLTKLYRSLVRHYWQDGDRDQDHSEVIAIQTLFTELQECWERTGRADSYLRTIDANGYTHSKLSRINVERYICEFCLAISDPDQVIHTLFWHWATTGSLDVKSPPSKLELVFVMKWLRTVCLTVYDIHLTLIIFRCLCD